MLTGVRYAAPPVGSLRFKRPAPVDVWTGVRNATSEGQPCAQREPICIYAFHFINGIHLNNYIMIA